MRALVQWIDKMKFEGDSRGLKVQMDAKTPLGSDSAVSPKELVLHGLCGCTAIDVMAFMRKHRQEVKSFTVSAETELTAGYPSVFQAIHLVYSAVGAIDTEKLKEAAHLSESKYCGVSAMLKKNSEITYEVRLNDQVVFDSRK